MLGHIYPILSGPLVFKECFNASEHPLSPKEHICSNSKHKKQGKESGKMNVDEILPFSII